MDTSRLHDQDAKREQQPGQETPNERRPDDPKSILALQRTAGNAAVSQLIQSSPPGNQMAATADIGGAGLGRLPGADVGPKLARWRRIGTERHYYPPTGTAPSSRAWADRDRPEGWRPNECNEIPVAAGTEAEWRRLLGAEHGNEVYQRVASFLRAYRMPDERRFQQWFKTGNRRLGVIPSHAHDEALGRGAVVRHNRDLASPPTHQDVFAFMKALYLREGSAVQATGTQALFGRGGELGMGDVEGLLPPVLAEFQPELIRRVTAAGLPFDREDVEAVAEGVGDESHTTMLVSALGSMVGAIGSYARRPPDNEEAKDDALMELRNACYVVTGTASVAKAIAATRRGWVESVIERSAGRVPGAGGAAAQALAGMFKDDLAEAIIADRSDRVPRIRRVVREKIAELERRERRERGQGRRRAPFVQTDVLNVVDSALAQQVEHG